MNERKFEIRVVVTEIKSDTRVVQTELYFLAFKQKPKVSRMWFNSHQLRLLPLPFLHPWNVITPLWSKNGY